MKKFIRSKILVDTSETSNRSSPNNLPDPPPPPNLESAVRSLSELQTTSSDTLESTSDTPANNAEPELEGYRGSSEAEPAVGVSPPEEARRPEPDGDEAAKPPESTIMCRDFIRGTCNRPGTCRYAHKCDKTQLFGVYTFCRNYQNKICTLPNCKYVHASVFEEQEFYRTGKLPPHVLAPKVPPPPPPTDPESRVNIPTSFANPPPMLPPSVQTNATFPCAPPNTTEPRIFQEEFGAAAAGGAARDGYVEPPPKKCKHCDAMDIRVRWNTELLEKKRESVAELKRKSTEVDSKKEKMSVVLTGLLKVANTSSTGPSSLFNIGSSGDNSKILLDLVNLNSSSRVAGGETSSAGLLGENLTMATMLANILLQHQTHAADASRRE